MVRLALKDISGNTKTNRKYDILFLCLAAVAPRILMTVSELSMIYLCDDNTLNT